MRKYLFFMTMLFMFATTGVANAQCPANIDFKPTISTSATASEDFTPDTAIITLAVETQAKTASEAASQNALKASNVVNKVKGMLNKNQGDKIQTTQYSINPVYEYDQPQKRSVLTGYRVTNQVTIITMQLGITSKIIDTAIANGANQVQGINFTIKNKQEYCDKVLAKAAQRARDEAQAIAQSLGVSITGIKQITSSCSPDYQPRPVYAGRALMMDAEAAPSTPIEIGEVKVQGTVNIDFYIK